MYQVGIRIRALRTRRGGATTGRASPARECPSGKTTAASARVLTPDPDVPRLCRRAVRETRAPAVKAGSRRGNNGNVRRSFGFAQAFSRRTDSAQLRGRSELQRTRANGRCESTSWGQWFEPSTQQNVSNFDRTRELSVAGASRLQTSGERKRHSRLGSTNGVYRLPPSRACETFRSPLSIPHRVTDPALTAAFSALLRNGNDPFGSGFACSCLNAESIRLQPSLRTRTKLATNTSTGSSERGQESVTNLALITRGHR